MSTTTSSVVKIEFEALLARVSAALPEAQGIRASVVARLTKLWEDPKEGSLAGSLGQAACSISADDARQAIFFPGPSWAARYPELLRSPPADADEKHPQFSVQIEFTTMLYLVHVPYSAWADFAEPFILAGGLEALAGMLEHPNLYLRGQVVDALHQLSGGDLQAKAASTGGFDWWDTASSTSSTESSKMALHAKMLALRECEAWLPGLVANAEPSNSYPGGPTACLQLLAFWLSWVRTLYSPSLQLKLGRTLRAALFNWGESSSSSAAGSTKNNGAGTTAEYGVDSVDPEATPETLLSLRTQLVADLGTPDPIEGAENLALGLDGSKWVQGLKPGVTLGLVHQSNGASAQEKKETLDEGVLEIDSDGGFDLSATPLPKPPSKAAATAPAGGAKPAADVGAPLPPPPPRDFSILASDPAPVSARAAGNAAFGAGSYRKALEHYAAALGELDKEPESTKKEKGKEKKEIDTLARDRATLHCNCANSYWNLFKHAEEKVEGKAGKANEDSDCDEAASAPEDLLAQCLTSAEAAVRADPTYFKAHYRVAACLEQRAASSLERVNSEMANHSSCVRATADLHAAIAAASEAVKWSSPDALNSSSSLSSSSTTSTSKSAKGSPKKANKGSTPATTAAARCAAAAGRAAAEKLLVRAMETLAMVRSNDVTTTTTTTVNAPSITPKSIFDLESGLVNSRGSPAVEDAGAAASATAAATTAAAAAASAESRARERVEREADVLAKILRRKDARDKHDYMAPPPSSSDKSEETNADNAVPPVASGFLNVDAADAEASSEGAAPEASDGDSTAGGVLSTREDATAVSGALVPAEPTEKAPRKPWTDAVVNAMLGEEEASELARAMELGAKDEDSDDDDVVARRRAAKLKQSNGKHGDSSKSSTSANSRHRSPLEVVLGDPPNPPVQAEEKAPQNPKPVAPLDAEAVAAAANELFTGSGKKSKPRKATGSQADRPTNKGSKVGVDKGKAGKEHKRQLDDLRRLAGSASNMSFE